MVLNFKTQNSLSAFRERSRTVEREERINARNAFIQTYAVHCMYRKKGTHTRPTKILLLRGQTRRS